MSNSSWLGLRLCLAILFGCALMSITFGVASQVAVGAMTREQDKTRYVLRKLNSLVNDYHAEHHVFPSDLKTIWENNLFFFKSDGWDRPFLYSIQNNQVLIESLGRDGKRGGIGLDADLSNANLNASVSQITFTQKMAQPVGQLFGAVALACGGIASGLMFVGLGSTPDKYDSWPLFGVQLLLTFGMAGLMAFFGAMFIAVAHIPSGH